jgi:hypothetical protein
VSRGSSQRHEFGTLFMTRETPANSNRLVCELTFAMLVVVPLWLLLHIAAFGIL